MNPKNLQKRPLLSIVVPVFEEIENLPLLLAEIEETLPRIAGATEVILVDDGSRDGTWEVIEAASATRPWLRALRFLANRGQTAAMAAGIGVARGSIIAFLDADLQNDPRDLPMVLAPILDGTTDVVCGWRANRQDAAFTRTLPSVIANFIIRKSLRFKVHDVGCTLKAFRREYIADVMLVGEMHRFLPSYAQTQGARIAEVVVSHRPRHAGKSKYGLNRTGKVIADLLTVKLLNQYGSSPAYLFGKVAVFFFGAGVATFAVVAYRVLVLRHYETTPMVFISMLMFIAALLSVMSGLLAELIIRVLHQVGGTRPFKIMDSAGFTELEESPD